jgi:hypothetical protein
MAVTAVAAVCRGPDHAKDHHGGGHATMYGINDATILVKK